MNKSISLTKTCNSCGLQKPLSAFLEFAGSQGAIYGNICAACRKANNDKVDIAIEPEDSTTSTSGKKIDAKAKVKEQKDKRELIKQHEENYLDERVKHEENRIKKMEKTKHIAHDEKKHRKGFLEKPSFLDSSKKPYVPSKVFGGEEQKASARKFDPSDTRIAGKIKSQSTVYQAFKTWLGSAAPIVSSAEKNMGKKSNNNNTAEKKVMEPLNNQMNKKSR